MAASRWQTNLMDLLNWVDEDDTVLGMLLPALFSRLPSPQNGESSNSEEVEQESNQENYPDELPILPLRGLVVYPQTAVPLTIGQPRSIKLVDDVVGGDKLVGLGNDMGIL